MFAKSATYMRPHTLRFTGETGSGQTHPFYCSWKNQSFGNIMIFLRLQSQKEVEPKPKIKPLLSLMSDVIRTVDRNHLCI